MSVTKKIKALLALTGKKQTDLMGSLGMSSKFNSYKTMRSGYPVTRTFTFGLNLSF